MMHAPFFSPAFFSVPSFLRGAGRARADALSAETNQLPGFDAFPAPIAILDQSGSILSVNPAWKRLEPDGGFAGQNFKAGTNYLTACERVGGELSDISREIASGIRRIISGEANTFEIDYPAPASRKQYRLIAAAARSTEPSATVLMHIDVSDQTRVSAPAAAEESANDAESLASEGSFHCGVIEPAALEADIRQSRHMESLGQLTGGIAHDFNNLLTVILGSAETLADQLGDDPALLSAAEMIRSAAESGAELTKQLLSFARRQLLEPRNVSPNELILKLAPLLRRTLAENVEVELHYCEYPWEALIDPVQLESALINICLNASDAMPEGGLLKIETSNEDIDASRASKIAGSSPGSFAAICVSDTGCGITDEGLTKIFEPFFTTKKVGKCTGLGLSMVYGFVRQSGGFIELKSQPGEGAAFKIFLPRATRKILAENPVLPELRMGTATILLVDDNDLVRRFAADQVRSRGYRVIEANDGVEAIAIITGRADIDLLFTDIAMPGGIDGHDLAAQARAIRPAMKILYTSGHDRRASNGEAGHEPPGELLTKPYRLAELAYKIEKALR